MSKSEVYLIDCNTKAAALEAAAPNQGAVAVAAFPSASRPLAQ